MGGTAYQIFTMIASGYGSLIMGIFSTWPSYTLNIYTSPNVTVLNEPMTEAECSLVGSLPSLGAMVGTAIAGPIIDRLGRKAGGIVISLPVILAWTIVNMSSTPLPIMVGRFLGGISGGSFLVFAPIFISEVAEDSIRGALSSAPVSFFCIGTMVSYLMGWFGSYRINIWINIALSVLCVLLCGLVVESPTYLMQKNREEDAKKAFASYRGASPSSKIVSEEMTKLKQKIAPAVEMMPVTTDPDKADEALKFTDENTRDRPKQSAFKSLFFEPASRWAFCVVGMAITMQVLMGMIAMQVYAKGMFATAAPNLSSHFCSVMFSVMMMIGCGVQAAIADKAGRRFLVITSSIGVSIIHVTLATLMMTGAGPAWMSAACILLFCFTFSMGAGTVPYVLLAECFIPEVQGLASMILVEWVFFLNFVLIALFPIMTKLLGVANVFYVFGVIALCNAINCYFTVPETKGLSTVEIQERFLRRSKN